MILDGMGWGGMGCNGVGWDGMGWDGMGWDDVGWDDMGWDGVGWDGMGWKPATFASERRAARFVFDGGARGRGGARDGMKWTRQEKQYFTLTYLMLYTLTFST